MERDIVEARKAMNLSLWDSYPADRRQTLAAKMVQEAKSHEMPPLQYRAIHWNAGVGDTEVKLLGDWAHAVQLAGAGGGMAGEGDPARGKMLFEKRCTGCHALTVNRQGPKLQGVYGRPAGIAEGYAYSAALKKAKIVWDDNLLATWLADPDAFLPGNDMDYLVVKAQDRLDLVSYLKQVSGR
jgi:cytochrome c